MGNFITRAIVAFCIMMQGAAILPHHHHGADGAACFDVSHCVPAHDCASGCEHEPQTCDEDSHGHDGATGDCTLRITAPEPRTERLAFKITLPEAPSAPALHILAITCPECLCRHQGAASDLKVDLSPHVERLHIFAAARIVPGRAPSFLA